MKTTADMVEVATCGGSTFILICVLLLTTGLSLLAAFEIRRRAKVQSEHAEKWLKTSLDLKKKLDDLNAELAFEKRFIDERKRRLERERDDFEREKLLFEHRKAAEK